MLKNIFFDAGRKYNTALTEYIHSFSSKAIWLSPCHCPERASGVYISTGIQIQNICNSWHHASTISQVMAQTDTEKVRKLISDEH